MDDDSSELRHCGGCGAKKPVSRFNWRRRDRGQRDNLCRPCRAGYHREHYLANKQRYVEQAARSKRRQRLKRTRFLLDFFKTHPCVDCGESDPVVLEFDHVRDKAFDVMQGFESRNWQAILAEIAKCDVVCANCRRRRTCMRRGALRVVLGEG
jgi:hypothetical protein